jgi:cytochrome c5
MEYKMNKKLISITILLGIAILISAACRLATGAGPTVSTVTQAHGTAVDGKTLLEERCSVCHSLGYIYNSRGTAAQWKAVVSMMKDNGAVLSPQEEKILDDYLAKNFQ